MLNERLTAVGCSQRPGEDFLNGPPQPEGSRDELQEQMNVTGNLSEGVVLIQFVDEDYRLIAMDNVLSGGVGRPYRSYPKVLPGYELMEVKGQPLGVFTQQETLVIYVYRPNKTSVAHWGSLIVMYLDTRGRDLGVSDIFTGLSGTMYQVRRKDIKGYEFSHVEGEQVGLYVYGVQTVKFYYKQVLAVTDFPRGHVVVEYVDREGHHLTKEDFLTGVVGSPYETVKKDLPGYQLLGVKEQDAKGFYREGTRFVTYVYQELADHGSLQEGVVCGFYLDEDGQEIAKRVQLTGPLGAAYGMVPKEIEGYQLVDVSGQVAAVFQTGKIHVKFYYRKLVSGVAEGAQGLKVIDGKKNQ